MGKTYRFTKALFIFLFSLCLGVIIILTLNYKDIYLHPIRFWLGISSSALLLLSFPEILSKEWILENKGISEKNKPLIKLYREDVKKLDWHEIGYIIDDYVQPILFYPPYKLHIFHLMPKDNITKPIKRISISWWIKGHKELISEIVSRVGIDTHIDNYVLKVVEQYRKNPRKEKKS